MEEKQIALLREDHAPIIEALLDGRISKKEITISVWAQVVAKRQGIDYEDAYKAAKNAARGLSNCGFGRYIEGRRGRVSRFRANSNIKDIAKSIVGAKEAAQSRIPKAKAEMAAPAGLTPSDIAALKALIADRAPMAAPAPEKTLGDFSMDELLAEIGRRTSPSQGKKTQ